MSPRLTFILFSAGAFLLSLDFLRVAFLFAADFFADLDFLPAAFLGILSDFFFVLLSASQFIKFLTKSSKCSFFDRSSHFSHEIKIIAKIMDCI